MAETLNMGWIKDNSGTKFAPKTLISQIQTTNGILLDEKMQSDINTAKDEVKSYVSANFALKSDLDNVNVDGFITIENPTGTGSLSMNRKPDTTIGDNSVALGESCEASGAEAFAEGWNTTANGSFTHAEGNSTIASNTASHAEGYTTKATGGAGSHSEGSWTTASAQSSHAEGSNTTASGAISHAEGDGTFASGIISHAEGSGTIASGYMSHAEGNGTIAAGEAQHVQGKNNIEDTTNTYAHIVGNGTSYGARSNAHTLDWNGNAWYQGTIKVGGTSYADASEVALKSDLNNVSVDLSPYETKTEAESKYALKSEIASLQAQIDELKDSIITVYSGPSSNPSNSIGEDGDIYFVS